MARKPSHPVVAVIGIARRALAPAVVLAAALAVLPAGAWAQLFVCKTPNGKTLTGDVPPPECKDVEIRELNHDGSIKRVIEPPLTPEEKRKQEVEEKEKRAREQEAREVMRKDRALLETYATEKEIDESRDRTLANQQILIERANEQLKQIRADRKHLEDEAEFYLKRKMPERLKRALEDNNTLQQQQLRTMELIREDMERINERYDAELQRFRELVNRGATPVQRPASDPPVARSQVGTR